MWSQWHAELWTVDERRKWTGSKSDSQLSDVEMNTNHLYGCRSPPPPLSPLFLSLQLFHPFPFSYLSLFGLEIAQSVIWGLAFCPAQPLPRHEDLSVVYMYMSPSHPDFLPVTPVLSCTSTLGILGRRHLLWKVKPPIRFSEGL